MNKKRWIAVLLVLSLLLTALSFGEGSGISDASGGQDYTAREEYENLPGGEADPSVLNEEAEDLTAPDEDEDLTNPDEAEDSKEEDRDDLDEEEELTDSDEAEEFEEEDGDDPEGEDLTDPEETDDSEEEEEDGNEPDDAEEEEPEDASGLPGMESAMIFVFTVEVEEEESVPREAETEAGKFPEEISEPEYNGFDDAMNPDAVAEDDAAGAADGEAFPLSYEEESETEVEPEMALLTGGDGTETEQVLNTKADAVADAAVSSLAVIPVATNEQYSTLTFSFTAGDKAYSCLVTGLEETGENPAEAYENLAATIAQSFLEGEVFTLSDQTALDEFGLSLDLIDAEKSDRISGDDSNICWAASAADMLEYAGWNTGEDEDDAFQEFRDEFDNGGGTQGAGISWYLDGVNPLQATYKSTGEVAYGGKPASGAAQQQTEGSGGYWKDYAAAQVAPESLESEEPAAQLEDAANKLEDGYAAGLGIYYYQNKNTVSSAHALTMFGYIREVLEESVGRLLALFVSDSNDRANGEEEAPENRPNEYVMYSLAPFENDQFSSVQLENYSQSSMTAAVGTVSTLAPQATAEKEEEGTRDATDTPNLVPTELHLLNEDGIAATLVEAGTAVTVETDFRNRGYQTLPAGSAIRYGVDVYRDGVLVEQVERTLEIGDEKGLRPNSGLADSVSVMLEEGGDYTFETRVLGITSDEGEPVAEAYVNDNLYAGIPRKLTVQAAEQPEEEGQSEKLEQADCVQSYTAPEMIYQLTVVLATDTEYRLAFEAAAAAPENFILLKNRKTGEVVDPDAYKIESGEEGFIISFEESFIRSLNPGNNDFVLTWEGGRVLIRITVL